MENQSATDVHVPIRENLVNTAVKFLQNPKVSSSPVHQKQKFLKSKGLTSREIQRACELASVGTNNGPLGYNQSDCTVIPMLEGPVHSNYSQILQPTLFYKIKEFFNGVAIITASCYCVYWFYKKVIHPLLFGSKKKDPPKDPVIELDKNIQHVKESINQVKSDVQQLTQNQIMDPSVPQLVHELKQDLASLKSLLLSRKQFPNAPASIPSWQLEASSQGQEKTTEREDDAGSGSSTNNSDSSLEMIREDPPKE
ncbi:PREDICTED: peroxisomal membrane protein PEX14 [Ceratosolen solmsi marchali]|uniref:Peroxisomal membrane protein PEX14 n=1 Tax=Ceratosolen solmsi marchali TaxID=326594 RepID=A0AAJ6YMF3_9HYME|nr:PREDICTED: peroxisomal membrane protein PEX14 [Ceratosolen solmsi marchali]